MGPCGVEDSNQPVKAVLLPTWIDVAPKERACRVEVKSLMECREMGDIDIWGRA